MRWIGLVLCALGLGVFAADVVSWLGGTEFWRTAALGDWINFAYSDGLQLLEAGITRRLTDDPDFWFDYVLPILAQPAFAILAGLGMVFLALSWLIRRRRR